MLTLFAIPKPFRGHIGIIQRNAIRSWALLRPHCELILFGDDQGTAEAAKAFGARHVPTVARNENGTPLVSDIFDKAQRTATLPLLCFINADIIVLDDLLQAVSRINRRRFLLLGQRWDVDMTTPLNFDDREWEVKLRADVRARGTPHGHTGVDYYVFPKGLWGKLPHFAVGRTAYDNWLIWRARALGVPVIDATRVVTCIHQNHDRTYESIGMISSNPAEQLDMSAEARHNLELAGGRYRMFTVRNANWVLTRRHMVPAFTPWYLWGRMKSLIRSILRTK